MYEAQLIRTVPVSFGHTVNVWETRPSSQNEPKRQFNLTCPDDTGTDLLRS